MTKIEFSEAKDNYFMDVENEALMLGITYGTLCVNIWLEPKDCTVNLGLN